MSAFEDPEKVAIFKQELKASPPAPWSVPVSEHHVWAVSVIKEAAVKAFGVAPRRPRKSYVSSASLDLVTARRGVLRVLKKISCAPCGDHEA
eukprot:9347404-Pyramimonas_sp.AAC.1